MYGNDIIPNNDGQIDHVTFAQINVIFFSYLILTRKSLILSVILQVSFESSSYQKLLIELTILKIKKKLNKLPLKNPTSLRLL